MNAPASNPDLAQLFQRIADVSGASRAILADALQASDAERAQQLMLAAMELAALCGLLAEVGAVGAASSAKGPGIYSASLSNWLGAADAFEHAMSSGGIQP
jgi:hypothetical protein